MVTAPDTPVFDAHTHIGEWGTWTVKGREITPFRDEICSQSDLRQHMQYWGIDRQIVMTHYHPELSVTFDRNQLALELAELDGVYAGLFFHPDYPDEAAAVIEQAADDRVKVLKTSADTWENSYDPTSWTDTQRETIEQLVSCATAHDLVFQFHTGPDKSDPRKVFRFIEQYPEPTYHLVHMGGTAGGHFALVPRLLEHLDKDVYVDTSWSRGFGPRWLATQLKQRDALDRMLFASDYPWGDIPAEYHKIRGLEETVSAITAEDVQRILYGNAEQLYC